MVLLRFWYGLECFASRTECGGIPNRDAWRGGRLATIKMKMLLHNWNYFVFLQYDILLKVNINILKHRLL